MADYAPSGVDEAGGQLTSEAEASQCEWHDPFLPHWECKRQFEQGRAHSWAAGRVPRHVPQKHIATSAQEINGARNCVSDCEAVQVIAVSERVSLQIISTTQIGDKLAAPRCILSALACSLAALLMYTSSSVFHRLRASFCAPLSGVWLRWVHRH